MTEARPCATGCRLRGQHHTDCADDTCRGCLPRPAEHGTLCPWCWQKLADAVAELPVVVEHLHATASALSEGKAARYDGDGRATGDPAESTVLHPSWLAADDLATLLGSWAHVVLEEHPAGLRGPNQRPWQGDVARWITPHLEWCARQEWVTEMRRELCSTIATARARWPLPDDVERHRPIPDVRCPRCDQVGLWYYPPAWYRQPFAVACQNEECGRTFDEDEWVRLVGLLERAKRMAS